jgi:type II secretory pathway pseudopilin PulG
MVNGRWSFSKSSLTFIELIIVLSVIFVLLGVFAQYALSALRIARETALRNELANIRTSVEHYYVVKGELPESLAGLMTQEFDFKNFDSIIVRRPFLEPFRVDKQGNLLDPFLNKYSYDKDKRRVYSQSEGYQNW